MKLIAALSTATALLGAAVASPAQATQFHRDVHINGYSVPFIYEASTRQEADLILVQGPYGLEYLSVRCDPYYWESTGNNTRNFANDIARAWCFGS